MERLDFNSAQDWPHRAASRFVEAGGIRWHVQSLGEGPSILFLHGTGASAHSWRRVAPFLAQRFTLILPDLPGHGFTSYPRGAAFTLPGMAEGLASLLQIFGANPSMVVGHSAGAAIAIRMTLDHRIAPRALIGVNAALHPFQGFAGQFFSPLAKMIAMNPFMPRLFAWRANDDKAVARLLEGMGSRISGEDVALYKRLFSSPAHCAAALAMMARWDLAPLVRELPKLETPLALIVGENDLAVRPSEATQTQRLQPRAIVKTLPGAGHLAHEEFPEKVAALIAAIADGDNALWH